MSLFFAYRNQRYTVLLADSLAAKPHPHSNDTIGLSASKLAIVNPGILAAHAGTWQPAWAMLSDLYHLTARTTRRFSHRSFCRALEQIGQSRYAEYQKLFKKSDFDVRVILVLTGRYRFPVDVQKGFSTSIALWEAARGFTPTQAPGSVYFGGSPALSSLALHYLEHPVTKRLLSAGPLAASQTLLSAHAAISHVSTAVSTEANVAIIGAEGQHTITRGYACTLPMQALIEG